MLLYIDPGTGSMLFTILLGIVGTGFFLFRTIFVKLKFLFKSGVVKKTDDAKLDIVIFSDHKRYWNIFEPICDEFERRKQKVVYMTASEDSPVFDKQYEFIESRFIGSGNKAFAKLNMLNACLVLSTTPGLNVYQWKRSKNVDYYIHMFHCAGNATMYRMFGLDFYDSVLLSGEYQKEQIRQLEQLRKETPKDVECVGIPYLDEMKLRYETEKKEIKKDSVKKTVLIAPSWGKSSLLSKHGDDIFKFIDNEKYNVIVRPHPQSFVADKEVLEKLQKKYPDNEFFHWNTDNDNFNVLMKSDILISDFSSVMFEYFLVFDKPIIYTKIDIDYAPYDASWLEEEPWTIRALPQIGMELNESNIESINEIIEECIYNPSYIKNREKITREMWMHPGEGTMRTVDYIQKKLDEL